MVNIVVRDHPFNHVTEINLKGAPSPPCFKIDDVAMTHRNFYVLELEKKSNKNKVYSGWAGYFFDQLFHCFQSD